MWFFPKGPVPRKLTVLLLGCGIGSFIGPTAWLPNMLAIGVFLIRYLVPSRDPENAEQVRQHIGLPPENVSNDFEGFLAKLKAEGKLPDVVAIAVETVHHARMILFAIRMGVKFIICDKPLVSTEEEMEEILAAAEEHGATIYVSYNHVANIAINQMREEPDQEEIEAWFLQSWLYTNPGGRQAEARLSDPLCTLDDLGAHVLHMAGYIGDSELAEVVEASVGTKGHHGYDCIDHGAARLKLKNGTPVTIRFSQAEENKHADNIGVVVRFKDRALMWRLFAPESLWKGERDADPMNLGEWELCTRGESDEFTPALVDLFGLQPGGHTLGWEGMWRMFFLGVAGDIYVALGILKLAELPPQLRLTPSTLHFTGTNVTWAIHEIVRKAGWKQKAAA